MSATGPISRPVDATVTVPGSKSLTNRALVCALLAEGVSILHGALDADDTRAMVAAVRALGATVDEEEGRLVITGTGGALAAGELELSAAQAGTVARFLPPVVAAAGSGQYRFDADDQMRARPMGPLLDALRTLGTVTDPTGASSLPVTVNGGTANGGAVSLRGDVSSQFLSGLLLAGPLLAGGLDVTLTTPLVSRPYVDMTAAVMGRFGAHVELTGHEAVGVAEGGYRPTAFAVEPDASAASYFFAAAAVCGGRVRVDGLGEGSLQGDLRFVDLLARMGATVHMDATHTEVVAEGPLRGIDVDMVDLSDTVPTLAVVAAFAEGPTRISGVGFIRDKESDRVGGLVEQLRRCGVDARELADGLEVHPGGFGGAEVRTSGDHRMAMAFAVAGLVVPGLTFDDPSCVAKTYPGFWSDLEALRGDR